MLAYNVFEAVVAGIIICLAWQAGGLTLAGLSCAKRLSRYFDRHWAQAPVLVAVVGFVVSAAVSWKRPPVPAVHDEFSYLLAADTYVHGRLANPSHPLWPHFEAFHVIQQPTYASKFPPGQGALLAAGQWLAGSPIVGSWIGVALASGAVCWMLGGWTRTRWAVLGGLLVSTNVGLQIHWGQSFWGGLVPLTGSALMFGALPRLARSLHARDAFVMALGVSILALSRPFEGFIVFIPALGWLLAHLWRNRIPWGQAMRNVLLPGGMVLVATAAFLLYFNLRVTGNPLTAPYTVHHAQYEVSPLLLFMPPREVPGYGNAQMEQAYARTWLEDYRVHCTWAGFLHSKAGAMWFIWTRFCGPLLTVPWLTLPWLWRSSWNRYAMLIFAGALGIEFSVCWLHSHYLAAAAPLLIVLTVSGIRHLRATWGRRHATLFAGAVTAYFLLCTLQLSLYSGTTPESWQQERARIADRLRKLPGNHLVIVRYRKDHDADVDWVSNEADIDASRVVWARELDPQSNRCLLNYFSDRRVWLLLADAKSWPLRELDRLTGLRLVDAPFPGPSPHRSP